MNRPDPRRARENYRRMAAGYDRRTAVAGRYRRRAIERLLLSSGDAVLDVACGTGINFDRLQAYIGPNGRIVGVDVSPEMLEQARARAEAHGWANVVLLDGAMQDVELQGRLDAALFSLTHDVLQSRSAVENVVRSLRPGGRVASFGAKWAPRWLAPVNLGARPFLRRYVSTLEGFDRPWRELERHIPDLVVEPVLLGAAYVAWGSVGLRQ